MDERLAEAARHAGEILDAINAVLPPAGRNTDITVVGNVNPALTKVYVKRRLSVTPRTGRGS